MLLIFLLSGLLIAVLITAGVLANAAAFRPPIIKEEPAVGRKVSFYSGKNRLTGFIQNETGTRGLVIIAHGMGTSAGYHLPEVQHFADEGYRVFTFEYSGYGGSTGHFCGFPQAVSDLKSAVEWIDDGSLPVILVGHSMGGYAVCTAAQYLSRPVSAIVAYAPFYSSGEAISEMTHRMPGYGWLLRFLVLPVQYVLFGASHGANGIDGLRGANAPALILQGKDDDEVSCAGCSVYAHRAESADGTVIFHLIDDEGSSGHMTVIRKKGTRCVNEDTMRIVDSFLDGIGKESQHEMRS